MPSKQLHFVQFFPNVSEESFRGFTLVVIEIVMDWAMILFASGTKEALFWLQCRCFALNQSLGVDGEPAGPLETCVLTSYCALLGQQAMLYSSLYLLAK